ncbi:MAG: hypothetical protein IJ013_00970 [Bacteroidaceae bacterium]|nr:hypothetical protein [Bacteroidaceae bacterium]
MKRLYVLTGILLGATTLQAQDPEKTSTQLDRTVVVENLYNPDIMNANKINIMPTLEEPQVAKKQIEYATTSHPSGQFGFAPMASFGETPQQADAGRGYFRLGYGNRGNVDSRLSYRFDLGKRDVLNANLAFRGMDGTIDLPAPIGDTEEWKARAYHTQGNLGWAHRFNPVTLSVEADAENQVFNYPYTNQWTFDNTHQHNLLGSLRASVSSNNHDADLRFQAGTGLLYAKQKYAFGYYDEQSSEPYAETIIRSHLQATGDINTRTSVHLHARMDNIMVNPGGDYNKVSLTVVQLNPHLTSEGKWWKVRIGAHIDPLFGNGGSEFSFAPDLYGEYRLARGYSLYLQAGGGRVVNDFRTINRFDPYAEFPVFRDGSEGKGFYSPRHSFHQLDGLLGFKATPLNELSLHLYGGYRITKEQLFSTLVPDYTNERLCYLMHDDANLLHAGASVAYAWKDLLTTRAEVEWSKWESDLTDTYSTLLPELSLRWSAEVHPIRALSIGLTYHYEQRCNDVAGNRPDAINNLGVHACYRLFHWLSLYAQGDNLLNQAYYRHILQPAQGFNVVGGAILEF